MNVRFVRHSSSKASPGIFPLSHPFLLSPLHVDFFPLPGQEQHSEPFFSLNAAAARRDYICVELSPQMLISCRLKVKAYASTAAFPRALGFLSFESESVCELKMETCCRWEGARVFSSSQVECRDFTHNQSTYITATVPKWDWGPLELFLEWAGADHQLLTWLRFNCFYDETRLLWTATTRKYVFWWFPPLFFFFFFFV